MTTTTIPSRCWRLQVFTDYGKNPRIEYLRERVRVYDDGGEIHDALPAIVRDLASIANEPLSTGPITISTKAELYAAVANEGHAFAAIDDAAAAAAAALAAANLTKETT